MTATPTPVDLEKAQRIIGMRGGDLNASDKTKKTLAHDIAQALATARETAADTIRARMLARIAALEVDRDAATEEARGLRDQVAHLECDLGGYIEQLEAAEADRDKSICPFCKVDHNAVCMGHYP